METDIWRGDIFFVYFSKPLMLATLGASLTCSGCMATAGANEASFISLSDSYVERDSSKAAQTYSEDAVVIYAYDDTPEERIKGRDAIGASFEAFFGRIDEDLRLDLNFRIAERDGAKTGGFYRLRFGNRETSYGRFDTLQNSNGLFSWDRSSSATRADFEETAGPLVVRPDENDLDRGYYGLLAGRYRLPDGCDLVVTRSIVRLFVRNTCDGTWRGMERVSGLEWAAGQQVLPDDTTSKFIFDSVDDTPSEGLRFIKDGVETSALRQAPYTTENIRFASADGTKLAGSVYIPDGASPPYAATVLVHGSGPQDRDGYASIIAVLADALASEGRVVLTYDKRGSGESEGNGNAASFDVLAADAAAAMGYLRARSDVSASEVGLAGSSQAGWVVAKAIEQGANPADVFLLGAAGAAFTVREQNLYNTEVRMRCAGLSEADRKTALRQQQAFFDALVDPTKASDLDRITNGASANPAVRDWLFPDSSGLQLDDAWFTVLDPTFDPLPIWRSYAGRAMFVFSEFDESTDTIGATDRLSALDAAVLVIPSAQHLALDASSVCDGEIGNRKGFSPRLFEAIKSFAGDR